MSKRIFDMSPRQDPFLRDIDFRGSNWEWPVIKIPSSELKSAEDFVRGYDHDVESSKLKEIIYEKDEEIRRLKRQLESK
jgi:hypothetical protein